MSNEEIEKPDVEANEQADTEASAETEKTTEQLLEEAQQQAEENWNQVLLARADLENVRRRHARDLENAHKHALDKFVNELLPICDSLELGLNAAKSESATLEAVRDGMSMTMKMLLDNIGKLGLEQVDPVGQPFDPELHQAVSMQPADGIDANHVISVMQKGYSFNGRLLRPAMVVVSQ
ncbi:MULTISPECIES: nucleotide exchange factor GrpE [unclassified Methylophaga]|mgnify:FL=1|jgi:molecular chaperone GrpE|uniref:nucleotide exchange factor GrpE n=1 Tax=unclassified Methylophaga TaxID=2629249 RepID=UPI0023B4426B|nr:MULTISPECIES: nucleotide exchange factor GrpE [unclassified Methylophaga]|tara:strand:- start:5391 stop:5930 length:540 start_codon:yes stop_codon:yes gene_type:complete